MEHLIPLDDDACRLFDLDDGPDLGNVGIVSADSKCMAIGKLQPLLIFPLM